MARSALWTFNGFGIGLIVVGALAHAYPLGWVSPDVDYVIAALFGVTFTVAGFLLSVIPGKKTPD